LQTRSAREFLAMAAPTDGDFDIYGEDEGFDVAQQHIDEVRLFPCLSFLFLRCSYQTGIRVT